VVLSVADGEMYSLQYLQRWFL